MKSRWNGFLAQECFGLPNELNWKIFVPGIRITFLVTKVESLTKPLTLRRGENEDCTDDVEDEIYAPMPSIQKIDVNLVHRSEDFSPRSPFLASILRLCQKTSRANSGIFTIETNMYSLKCINKGRKTWEQIFFLPTFVENKINFVMTSMKNPKICFCFDV